MHKRMFPQIRSSYEHLLALCTDVRLICTMTKLDMSHERVMCVALVVTYCTLERLLGIMITLLVCTAVDELEKHNVTVATVIDFTLKVIVADHLRRHRRNTYPSELLRRWRHHRHRSNHQFGNFFRLTKLLVVFVGRTLVAAALVELIWIDGDDFLFVFLLLFELDRNLLDNFEDLPQRLVVLQALFPKLVAIVGEIETFAADKGRKSVVRCNLKWKISC